MSLYWTDDNGQPFWTDERERKFLFGTAAPDEAELFYIDRFGEEHSGITHSGRYHIILFDSDGSVRVDNAAKYADIAADKAIQALNEFDCGLAAFYLGQMTHFIADVSQFMHISDHLGIYTTEHQNFEFAVQQKTNGIDDTTNRWSENALEKWFEIYDHGLPWFTYLPVPIKTPGQLAIEVARKTNYAYNYGDFYSPEGMKSVMFAYDLHIYSHYNNINDYWVDDSHWTSDIEKFMDTIEFTLNNAIDACGSALQYVKTRVGSFTCRECDSFDQLIDDVMAIAVQGTLLPLSFFLSITQLGIWAATLAMPISEAKNEIFKGVLI